MKNVRLYSVIEGPVVSEKSTRQSGERRQVVFKVARVATKDDIKKAVELLFKVEVDSVNVVNTKGKTKRFGRFMGSRQDSKKAYVQLKQGFDIDFAAA